MVAFGDRLTDVTAVPGAVSAVIVHYRGGDHLGRCVASCLDSPSVAEVLVVDNEGVGARLRSQFAAEPRVAVIETGANLGFGRAANVGLAHARSAAVLVLNQDVVIPPETVGAMLDVGVRAGAWIVGPRLRDADGQERSRKVGFAPPLQWSAPHTALDGPWRFAPYVVGAAVLFMPGHTDLRFDDRFFMYGEDEDLGWRVWQAGGTVIALEEAWATHVGGTATAAVWSPRRTEWRIVWNRARFIHKHAGWRGAARYAVTSLARTPRQRGA